MFIISFDESHGLTDTLRERGDDGVSFYPELRRAIRQMRRTPSLWVLFLATSGKFHLFSPDRQYERSDRLVKDLLRTFPPITEVEMDKWAQHVPCDGTWSLDRIASTYNISHLGRALYVFHSSLVLRCDLNFVLQVPHPLRSWKRDDSENHREIRSHQAFGR